MTYADDLGWEAFQSTLPVGGATRAPRREHEVGKFQSTLPVGGATGFLEEVRACIKISIHAPRGGSDAPTYYRRSQLVHFNPRSPWGERPWLKGEGR